MDPQLMQLLSQLYSVYGGTQPGGMASMLGGQGQQGGNMGGGLTGAIRNNVMGGQGTQGGNMGGGRLGDMMGTRPPGVPPGYTPGTGLGGLGAPRRDSTMPTPGAPPSGIRLGMGRDMPMPFPTGGGGTFGGGDGRPPGNGGLGYVGGSPNFDESTGQYRQGSGPGGYGYLGPPDTIPSPGGRYLGPPSGPPLGAGGPARQPMGRPIGLPVNTMPTPGQRPGGMRPMPPVSTMPTPARPGSRPVTGIPGATARGGNTTMPMKMKVPGAMGY